MAQRLCVAFANFRDRIALRQIERQFIDRGRALQFSAHRLGTP
jgi:hypothetical protein